MAACKIVVAPHVGSKVKHEYPFSQRGWLEATRRAKNIAREGISNTIFVSCDRGELRVAACHEGREGATCRLDAEIGGKSARVLAGSRKRRRR